MGCLTGLLKGYGIAANPGNFWQGAWKNAKREEEKKSRRAFFRWLAVREMSTVNSSFLFFFSWNWTREWFTSLPDEPTRARIRARLARVRLGNYGDHKSIGDGVYELRLCFGPGYRIYYAETGRIIVLLLCGGDKSTQKSDIQKAKNYWADYRRRTYETK